MGFVSTQSLNPEAIPLDIKVILFGDRELYYLLAANDPDFTGFFKVQADFDDTIARSTENDNALCAPDRVDRQGTWPQARRMRRVWRASSMKARAWPTIARSFPSRLGASLILCARPTIGPARPSAR